MMKRWFALALLLATALASPAGAQSCGPGGDAACFTNQPIVVGSPTGGAKGVGTINTSAGYFTNGVAIAGTVPGAIPGDTTGVAAAAGNIGELIENVIAGPVSITTATDTVMGSVALGVGDWQCGATLRFTPAGTTTVSKLAGQLSAGTTIGVAGQGATILLLSFTTGAVQTIPIAGARVLAPAPVTISLVANSAFAVSTMAGSGYIGCRRAR
jgi:hypothetical protein